MTAVLTPRQIIAATASFAAAVAAMTAALVHFLT